jgi:ribosomal protein S18 acetylase RimI-like enzyme
MYVDAEFRRCSVAKAMLARAEVLHAGRGVRSLFLTSSSLNRAAIELYRSAGYRQNDYVAGSSLAAR